MIHLRLLKCLGGGEPLMNSNLKLPLEEINVRFSSVCILDKLKKKLKLAYFI